MCECATGMGQRTWALSRPGWPRLAVVSILTDYWLNWTLSPAGSECAGSRVRGGYWYQDGTTLKKCRAPHLEYPSSPYTSQGTRWRENKNTGRSRLREEIQMSGENKVRGKWKAQKKEEQGMRVKIWMEGYTEKWRGIKDDRQKQLSTERGEKGTELVKHHTTSGPGTDSKPPDLLSSGSSGVYYKLFYKKAVKLLIRAESLTQNRIGCWGEQSAARSE